MLPIITTDSGFSTCFPYFLCPKGTDFKQKSPTLCSAGLNCQNENRFDGKKRKSIFWPMCRGRTPHRERKTPALV